MAKKETVKKADESAEAATAPVETTETTETTEESAAEATVVANGKFQTVKEGDGYRVYGPAGQKVSPVTTQEKADELVRKFNR